MSNKMYISHTYCGVLQCSPTKTQLLSSKYGRNAKPLVTYANCHYPYQETLCFSTSIDFGFAAVDPGLVATGTKCDENKACLDQKCVSLDDLKSPSCINGCSGNGVCNNMGECHCEVGFGPPSCDTPGPGGSQSSGPRQMLKGSNFILVMYLLFFCVYPCLILSLSLAYIYFWGPKPDILRKKCFITTFNSTSHTWIQCSICIIPKLKLGFKDHVTVSTEMLDGDDTARNPHTFENDVSTPTYPKGSKSSKEFPVLQNVADLAKKFENMDIFHT